MNVSPHHQRPAKYPWPGLASRAMVVVGIVVTVVIGYLVISGWGSPDEAAPASSALVLTAA